MCDFIDAATGLVLEGELAGLADDKTRMAKLYNVTPEGLASIIAGEGEVGRETVESFDFARHNMLVMYAGEEQLQELIDDREIQLPHWFTVSGHSRRNHQRYAGFCFRKWVVGRYARWEPLNWLSLFVQDMIDLWSRYRQGPLHDHGLSHEALSQRFCLLYQTIRQSHPIDGKQSKEITLSSIMPTGYKDSLEIRTDTEMKDVEEDCDERLIEEIHGLQLG